MVSSNVARASGVKADRSCLTICLPSECAGRLGTAPENADKVCSFRTLLGLVNRCRVTVDDRDATHSLGPHDLDRHLLSMAISHYVHAGLPESQISQQYRVEETRQAGISEADFILWGIEFQSERGLKHQEK